MKLYKLLKNINCRVLGRLDIEIGGLYHNDKSVKEEGLFFCLDGKVSNGIDFARSAISNGAVAIVAEREICGICATQIIVKNVRRAMSLIACNFYDNPAKKLKILGVTGTNGKTTITYMLSGLIKEAGKKCVVIGTNGAIFGDKIIETSMTTPDPIELQKLLAIAVKNNFEYVCMEVSAHAIYLNKVDGLVFESIIFTNLTEDHLDYFETMQNYFNAKKKIFNKGQCKLAIINVDDEYGKKLANCIEVKKITYSIKDETAMYFASDLEIKNFKQYFKLNGKLVESKFLGNFNVMNFLASFAGFKTLNLNYKNITECINNLQEVPGRFNTIKIFDRLFVVDYAHTPDGLENVLNLSKQIAKRKKLICVFGCGGNRETQKRSKMGEISSKIADFTIITSDNPRFEKRIDIAKNIESGIVNSNYKIIIDRIQAIKFAFSLSKAGDVILVAGKGAENYIDENGIKTYYSDFDVIRSIGENNE